MDISLDSTLDIAAFAVPAGLGAAEAALAEPMAVAVHAVRRAPQLLGASVMVLGAGPIGLGVLQAASAAGATTTIVTEVSPARREAAAKLGATAVVDPANDDVRAAVRDVSREGVDVVFETTANDTALGQGLAALRPRGTLVSVAGWGELARVDMGLAMAKEIDIRYTMTYEPAIDFPATLAMLADGRFDTGVMISDHIPLDRVIEEVLNSGWTPTPPSETRWPRCSGRGAMPCRRSPMSMPPARASSAQGTRSTWCCARSMPTTTRPGGWSVPPRIGSRGPLASCCARTPGRPCWSSPRAMARRC